MRLTGRADSVVYPTVILRWSYGGYGGLLVIDPPSDFCWHRCGRATAGLATPNLPPLRKLIYNAHLGNTKELLSSLRFNVFSPRRLAAHPFLSLLARHVPSLSPIFSLSPDLAVASPFLLLRPSRYTRQAPFASFGDALTWPRTRHTRAA